MRPVNRGPIPTDESGNEIEFKTYQDARGKLIGRLGEICSYCEMHLDSGLAVEHIRPKKPDGVAENIIERELDWYNFLLACPNCNSTKGNKDVVPDDYFWPDRDNTFRVFNYSEGGIIKASDALSAELKDKANATLKLTGLDNTPLNDPKASDRRWINRRETWDIAIRNREHLSQNENDSFREIIVTSMTGRGYWSIWMTVFKDNSDMLQRFIKALPGTADDCFDHGGIPIQRRGGQV
ncbi:MAG: HNH endonuclease [Thermodesulfovibrionia bacterium]|nr:HNH endonuclease [Thermodesulfovibrionia bacterium]